MTTYDHIQELRAELRNAVCPEERCWILAELAKAEAQFAIEDAELVAAIFAEPPH